MFFKDIYNVHLNILNYEFCYLRPVVKVTGCNEVQKSEKRKTVKFEKKLPAIYCCVR